MTVIINTGKQKQGFNSKLAKKTLKQHGVATGVVWINPGENRVDQAIYKDIKDDNFFKLMEKDNILIVKTDKADQQAQADAEKQAKAEAKALADAKAKAQAEAAKADQPKIDQLKKDLAEAGVDKRKLNGKNLDQLTAMLEEATKA